MGHAVEYTSGLCSYVCMVSLHSSLSLCVCVHKGKHCGGTGVSTYNVFPFELNSSRCSTVVAEKVCYQKGP